MSVTESCQLRANRSTGPGRGERAYARRHASSRPPSSPAPRRRSRSPAAAEQRDHRRVERDASPSVVDGDTIRLTDGRRVRLVQIDAPELGDSECYARRGDRALARLAPPGTRVRLEADPALDDHDRFGRLLRYVFVGGDEREPPARRGGRGERHGSSTATAGATRTTSSPPRTAARAAGAGLWRACPGHASRSVARRSRRASRRPARTSRRGTPGRAARARGRSRARRRRRSARPGRSRSRRPRRAGGRQILGRDVAGRARGERAAADAADRRVEDRRAPLQRRPGVREPRRARVVEMHPDRPGELDRLAGRPSRTWVGVATPIVSAKTISSAPSVTASSASPSTRSAGSTAPSNGQPNATEIDTVAGTPSSFARASMRAAVASDSSTVGVRVALVERVRGGEGQCTRSRPVCAAGRSRARSAPVPRTRRLRGGRSPSTTSSGPAIAGTFAGIDEADRLDPRQAGRREPVDELGAHLRAQASPPRSGDRRAAPRRKRSLASS